MRCYDCGHQAHGGQDCIECLCPTWRDPIDGKLRDRPSEAARRAQILEDREVPGE